MKKFILNSLAFFTIIFSVYFFLSSNIKKRNDITSNDYMLAIIDKHQRIEDINSPKIIFAGGSNLAFGINSEKIQNELNMPVVNLGLHAGLGLDFMLSELKDVIKEDDIVILSMEYFLDDNGDIELKKHLCSGYAHARKYYPYNIRDELYSDIFNLRLRIKLPLKAINNDSLPKNKPYTRAAFNKYGDHIAHLNKDYNLDLQDRILLKYSYWSGIKKINELNDYAKIKNVKLYFMFPPYPDSEYSKNKNSIMRLSADISKNIEAEILSRPEDFVFSDSLFFDTVYHLNKEGRELRTKKIIELLNRPL